MRISYVNLEADYRYLACLSLKVRVMPMLRGLIEEQEIPI